MKTRTRFITSACTILTGLLFSVTAGAQGQSFTSLLNTTKTVAKSGADQIIDIAMMILGIVGVILAAIGAFNQNSGDRDGIPKLMKNGLYIIGAVFLIEICRYLM